MHLFGVLAIASKTEFLLYTSLRAYTLAHVLDLVIRRWQACLSPGLKCCFACCICCRLALSRSTPNLLAIGLDKAAVCADDPFADTVGGGDKLVEFRNGDNNPAVLYRMVSREDLLE